MMFVRLSKAPTFPPHTTVPLLICLGRYAAEKRGRERARGKEGKGERRKEKQGRENRRQEKKKEDVAPSEIISVKQGHCVVRRGRGQ